MTWQQTNIQAAAAYLRERIAAGAVDARTKAVYEGLLEVLDPTRRAARVQRENIRSGQGGRRGTSRARSSQREGSTRSQRSTAREPPAASGGRTPPRNRAARRTRPAQRQVVKPFGDVKNLRI